MISVSNFSGCPPVLTTPSLLQLVDEMSDIVRDLCGETTLHGFDNLQRDYLGKEEEAIGGGFSKKV
jgi:hypothetical protein